MLRLNKWMLSGAAAVAAGALMISMGYATSGVVHAGNQVPCGSTPFVPIATPMIEEDSIGSTGPDLTIASQREECTATPTVGRLKTHTPTATSTPAPKTPTPVPPTIAPTNTRAPQNGNEGVSVKPPNTGTGGGASGGTSMWLLMLGAATIVFGGGALVTGMRRR